MWEKIKDWCYWHEGVVTFIIAFLIAIAMTGLLFWHESHFYHEEETMIVEVTDMTKWKTTGVVPAGKTLVPRTQHHYKLVCGNIEFKVDEATYESTSVGDRIIIFCKYKYRKKDNALINVTYEYAGD